LKREASGLPFFILGGKMKVCVFVDGENFRYAICNLFSDEFDKDDYLPKKAKWADFFDWIVSQATETDGERLRTYWYVTDMIDYYPYKLPFVNVNPQDLKRILCKDDYWKDRIAALEGNALTTALEGARRTLESRKHNKNQRFAGWKVIQGAISSTHNSIEFRAAGAISYNLFHQRFGKEKAVDVNLAVDMFRLKNIYDTAIIVSGDQDYVPAVKAIKDSGKTVVNVAFKKRNGKLLPGGARRLNQNTDNSLEVGYDEFRSFLNF
jgi:uncharacterized LabA/DUF88 family protein